MCLKTCVTHWKRLCGQIVIITLAYFLCSLFLAIAFYPSGERRFFGYSFLNSFISELGTTVTCGGMSNLISCFVFNTSLALSMLVLIPYWYIRKDHLTSPSGMGWLVFFCLCVFSLGLFTAAVVPYDCAPRVHTLAVNYTLFAAIVGLVLTTLLTDRAYYPKSYKLSWLIFIVLVLMVEFVLEYAISQDMLRSRPINPILQKVNVLVFIVWLVSDIKTMGRCALQE